MGWFLAGTIGCILGMIGVVAYFAYVINKELR